MQLQEVTACKIESVVLPHLTCSVRSALVERASLGSFNPADAEDTDIYQVGLRRRIAVIAVQSRSSDQESRTLHFTGPMKTELSEVAPSKHVLILDHGPEHVKSWFYVTA
jgi:hypothetical protein